MIEFTKGYKTSDGKLIATIGEAQLHELGILFGTPMDKSLVLNPENRVVISKFLLDNKDKFIDILTTTANSKPKARTVNGGRKNRKTVITNAAVSIGSTSNTPSTTLA